MLNNLTIKHLRAFAAVAKSGKFRVAAEQLGVSSPALSVCVRQMEEFLQLPLFDRTTRQVRLTAIGADFLPVVEQLILDFDAAVVDIQNTAVRKRGRVIIACLPSMGARFMPVILAQYQKSNPNIITQIQDNPTSDIMTLIVRNQVDFGINSQWRVDPELQFTPVIDDAYVAIFPASSPLAEKTVLRWKEIINLPFVAMTHGTHTRELMDAALAQRRMAINPFYLVSQIHTIVGMVAAGMGISAVPENALPETIAEGLVTRPIVDPVVTRVIGFTMPRRKTLSPAAEAFMAVCREVIEQTSTNSQPHRHKGGSKTGRITKIANN